jgi:predicted MFS family arabinose efflux permease
LTSTPQRESLWSAPLTVTVGVSFACFTGYHTLLVLLPYYVGTMGGSNVVVGAVTAAFMISATVAPLLVLRAMDRTQRLRGLLASGCALLAVSTGALIVNHGVAWLLVINGLRGVGFAIMAAVTATMVARFAPPSRRGAAVGMWGLAATVPAAFGPSVGLLVSQQYGIAGLAGVAALITLLTVPALLLLREPPRKPAATRAGASVVSRLRSERLSGPLFIFAVATAVYGAVVTFAPLRLLEGGPRVPAAYFLVMGCAIPPGRLIGGALRDGRHARHVLAAGCLIAAGGATTLVRGGPLLPALASALLFGVGFGVLTTAAQSVLMERAGTAGHGTANALFSAVFNGGIGAGALGFGLLAGGVGYQGIFLLGGFALAATAALATRW